MTAATDTAGDRAWLRPAAWRNLLRDYPLIPLTILLVLLVLTVELARPGTVNANWAAFAVRQAAVLAILAGCQTLTMLTGGIDLSVGYVASMAGFVTATFVHQPGGWALGVAVALGASALAGLVSGIGIGVFRVHPLIMTLGMGLIVFGFSNVWQLQSVQTGVGRAGRAPHARHGPDRPTSIPNDLLVFVPVAVVHHPHVAAHRVRPDAVRDRRQPGCRPPVRRSLVAGAGRAVRDLGPAGRHRRAAPVRALEHGQRHARHAVPAAVGRRGGHRRDVDPGRPRRLLRARSSAP